MGGRCDVCRSDSFDSVLSKQTFTRQFSIIIYEGDWASTEIAVEESRTSLSRKVRFRASFENSKIILTDEDLTRDFREITKTNNDIEQSQTDCVHAMCDALLYYHELRSN